MYHIYLGQQEKCVFCKFPRKDAVLINSVGQEMFRSFFVGAFFNKVHLVGSLHQLNKYIKYIDPLLKDQPACLNQKPIQPKKLCMKYQQP